MKDANRHYIDASKELINDFLDCLMGNLIDNSFLTINPKNTYEEILVVSIKDVKKVLDSFKYELPEE